MTSIFQSSEKNKTCRACLKYGSIPIHSDNFKLNVSEALRVICGIEVEAQDCYPKYLCKSCHSALVKAYRFRESVQYSDGILRNQVPTIATAVKEEEQDFPELELKESSVVDVQKYLILGGKAHSDVDVKESDEEDRDFSDLDEKSPTDIKITDYFDIKVQEPSEIDGTSAVNNEIFNAINEEENKPKKIKRERKRREKFRCRPCNDFFYTRQKYKEHKLSEKHKLNKNHCSICNKDYQNLRQHMARHEEKSIICDICGKKFTYRSVLIRHKAVHVNELPYHCSMCPYKGRYKGDLIVHMRIHTGERPYECTICSGRYVTKSNLNKHLKTHNKKRHLTCEICGKQFTKKEDVDKHIKLCHNSVKDYDCEFCEKTFAAFKYLRKHQLNIHKGEKLRSGRMPIYMKLNLEKNIKVDLEAKHVS